ncbi:MAG: cytochrome c biogenesis protein CcdA, partial [Cyanobacteria bacterium J06648_11]
MQPVWDSLQLWLYRLDVLADRAVQAQLDHLSLASVAIIFAAGLVTSLSPCMVSMLPVTVGFIGGYADDDRRWQTTAIELWRASG